MTKLSPCPFCGWPTPALKDAGMMHYHVQCPACGASGSTCKNSSTAENQWNMRQDLPNKHTDIAGSSNGRTADFESVNGGSSPSPAANDFDLDKWATENCNPKLMEYLKENPDCLSEKPAQNREGKQ